MKRFLLVAFALTVSSVPAMAKQGTVACQRVFVTGTQTHEIEWALHGNNLFKLTCMQPVDNPAKADAILDIEVDPKTAGSADAHVREREDALALASGSYWVTCNSDAHGAYCLDSAGFALETDCDARRCSSYYGPSAPVVALQVIGDALVSWSEKRAAWAYMFSARGHQMIWKYEGIGTWQDDLQSHADCRHKSFVMGRGCK